MWLQSLAQLLSGPPTQSGSGNLTSPNNAEIHWSDVELSRSTAKKTWGGCCDSGSCSSSWPPAYHPTSRGNWSTGVPARQKIETRTWNKKKGANCKFLPDQPTLLEAWWQPGVLWGASSQSDQPWLSGPGTSGGFFKYIQNRVTPSNN